MRQLQVVEARTAAGPGQTCATGGRCALIAKDGGGVEAFDVSCKEIGGLGLAVLWLGMG